MPKEELITGLDVGSSKVAAAVAVRGENGSPRIVGWATGRSEGIRKGIVIDMEAVIESVSRVLLEVQASAGSEIESVIVNVSGGHIQGRNSRGVVAVSGHGDEISRRDVARVIEAAGTMAIPHDRQVLHVIQQEFTLDDQRGIRDPVGMSGIRLEAEVHLITGSVSSLKNLIKSVKMAGVEVDAMILDSVADGYSAVSEDEKEMGTAVVNVGGDVTGLALFSEGSLRHSGVLLVGGEHVTNDVAIVQRMSIAEAESLKIRDGSVVPSKNGDGPAREPQGTLFRRSEEHRFELAHIIRSRMEELFELARAEFENSPHFETIPAGIVLTGGGARLGRLTELAESVFDRPTRVGRPRSLDGWGEKMIDPAFTTLAGLVLYGCDARAGRRCRHRNGSGVLGGVIEWLKVLKGDTIW